MPKSVKIICILLFYCVAYLLLHYAKSHLIATTYCIIISIAMPSVLPTR